MQMIGNFIGVPRLMRLYLNTIGGSIEIKAPGNTGREQNGNWRLNVNSNNKYDLSKYKGGAWVMVKEDYL